MPVDQFAKGEVAAGVQELLEEAFVVGQVHVVHFCIPSEGEIRQIK